MKITETTETAEQALELLYAELDFLDWQMDYLYRSLNSYHFIKKRDAFYPNRPLHLKAIRELIPKVANSMKEVQASITKEKEKIGYNFYENYSENMMFEEEDDDELDNYDFEEVYDQDCNDL